MKPSSPLFLGLDVGTQSVRAALFDLFGNCAAFSTSPIETFHPRPGWAEQEPGQWWNATQKAVSQALAKANVTSDKVVGIGLDCTACTVLPCQRDGTPLSRALFWMDQRSFRQAEETSSPKDEIL